MANPFPFASGQVLTAADMNSIGAWTSFTTSGSNCTISSQSCWYAEINEIVVVQMRVDVSAITGSVDFTLPVNADTAAPSTSPGSGGSGVILDGSNTYNITPYIYTSTQMRLYHMPEGAAGGVVSSTRPVANWDNFRVLMTYRAA